MPKWLENSLDMGITEAEFWSMTIGELKRVFESRARIDKLRAQEKATFDYTLAELIGRSIARLYNSANHMPDISDVYPTLFNSQELKKDRQERQAELSALRFKQFAQAYNENFNKEAAKD